MFWSIYKKTEKKYEMKNSKIHNFNFISFCSLGLQARPRGPGPVRQQAVRVRDRQQLGQVPGHGQFPVNYNLYL